MIEEGDESFRILWRRLASVFLCALVWLGAGCSEGPSGSNAEAGPAASTPSSGAAEPLEIGWNIVLVTLDTTRADALGAYGQPLDTTPALDRLAREGVLFDRAVTSSPSTLPSHATILTGKHPYAHGVRSNIGYILSDQVTTLPELLRAEGYRTGVEIAAPVLERRTRITRGFEEIRDLDTPGVELKRIAEKAGGPAVAVDPPTRTARDISRGGIAFIRRHRDQRFLLWLHYYDAHDPYSPPAPFAAKIPDNAYLAEVASVDAELGKVIEEIRRTGLRDRTLVVVAGDHGEGLGEHGEAGHSYFLYRSTVSVPLIFWGPKEIRRGLRVESLVRTADIAPTVLDLLDLPPATDVQGVSLRRLLTGEESDLGLTGYGESIELAKSFALQPLRFISEGRWKYIHKVNPELYDISLDPDELSNLAAREPDVVARLQARLRELVSAAPQKPDDAEASVDPETRAQLVALGYAAAPMSDALDDELATLELVGEDASEKAEDVAQVQTARQTLASRRYADAYELLRGLAERNPNSAYVLGLTAQSLAGLEKAEEAIPLFQRAIELDPCSAEARVKLSELQHSLGRYV